jgi:IS30 family transposase
MLITFSPARDATMKTFKQLLYEQRCQIYALSKTGMSQNKIAKQLKVSQLIFSREFSRKTGKRGYRFKQAQTSTDTRRLAACKATKITTALIALIKSKLTTKWSPEQVSGWLGEGQCIDISYETIYQHVWSDKKRWLFIPTFTQER